MDRYPRRRRRQVRENPLSEGETVALVAGGIAVVGVLIYALTGKTPASSAGNFQAGHRYSLSGPLDSSGLTSAPSVSDLQSQFDAANPGEVKVVSSTVVGSNLVIVFDLLTTPPAGANIANIAGSGATVTDLGPTPS